MNGPRVAALLAALAGVGLLAYAVATGQARVGFFLVFPFVSGTGLLPLLAMLLLFAAFVLWTAGTFARMRDAVEHAPPRERAPPPPPPWGAGAARDDVPSAAPTRAQAKSGGVVLLGPIPIVWGSDRRILPWMIAAGAALLLLSLALSVALNR